jgi:hypothetical protein
MKKIYFTRLSKVITYIVIASTLASPVSALNEFYSGNDILFYDKNAQANSLCTPGGDTSLSGSSGEEKTWNFLRSKGLTAEQTAGIAGNLKIESGFIPDNQEDSQPFPNGGWGIAQWTGSRRTDLVKEVLTAKLPYTNESTPANQVDKLLLFELNYLWSEATGGGMGDPIHKSDIIHLRADTQGKTGNDAVTAAAVSWHKWYEISADATPQKRINAALKIYATYKDAATTTSSTTGGCSNSPFATVDGFTYFSQYDPAWADKRYGTSTIQQSGCGPTSMAMIISSLSNRTVTPEAVATFGAKYYIEGAGSDHALFAAAATNWGLKSAQLGVIESQAKDVLSKGGLIVATGKGPYPYTTAGHVIVIRGIASDGTYLVGNPLPLSADQGKTSADTVKNTSWFSKGYTWSELSASTSSMYSVTK